MHFQPGTIIGSWTIMGPETKRPKKPRGFKYYVLCRCICGKEKSVSVSNLQSGQTKSCGCQRKNNLRHGMSDTPEYRAWLRMKQRCYDPNATRYEEWGGRGITVCDRWVHSFQAFYDDMGPLPSPIHSLDRINNDLEYSPDNCTWSTPTEQSRNTRRNRLIEYKGEIHPLVKWAEITGLKRTTISERLRRGWSVEDALMIPLFNQKVHKK